MKVFLSLTGKFRLVMGNIYSAEQTLLRIYYTLTAVHVYGGLMNKKY